MYSSTVLDTLYLRSYRFAINLYGVLLEFFGFRYYRRDRQWRLDLQEIVEEAKEELRKDQVIGLFFDGREDPQLEKLYRESGMKVYISFVLDDDNKNKNTNNGCIFPDTSPTTQLLQCWDTDRRLSRLGRMILRGGYVTTIKNRLLIQRDIQEHPEILSVEIKQVLPTRIRNSNVYSFDP